MRSFHVFGLLACVAAGSATLTLFACGGGPHSPCAGGAASTSSTLSAAGGGNTGGASSGGSSAGGTGGAGGGTTGAGGASDAGATGCATSVSTAHLDTPAHDPSLLHVAGKGWYLLGTGGALSLRVSTSASFDSVLRSRSRI